MNRCVLVDEETGNQMGWFDVDTSTFFEAKKYNSEGAIYEKDLYVTKSGRYIFYSWSNVCGVSSYYYPAYSPDLAEWIIKHGYDPVDFSAQVQKIIADMEM